jgi:hypothetical protein
MERWSWPRVIDQYDAGLTALVESVPRHVD